MAKFVGFVEANDIRLAIVIPAQTLDRLNGTCFRGRYNKLAGNFSRWTSAGTMFRDDFVKSPFLDEIRKSIKAEDGCVSFTVEHHDFVGWESTAPRENYPDEVLESFQPNTKSRALRVRLDRTDVLAPKTKCITFICEVHYGSKAVLVRSIYPGEDVGPLKGDITRREGRVFFDWKHPGE